MAFHINRLGDRCASWPVGTLLLCLACASSPVPLAQSDTSWEQRVAALRALFAEWPAPISPEIAHALWVEPLERRELTPEPAFDCGIPAVVLRGEVATNSPLQANRTVLEFEPYHDPASAACKYRLSSIWLAGDAPSLELAKEKANLLLETVGGTLSFEGGPDWKWERGLTAGLIKIVPYLERPYPPGPTGLLDIRVDRVEDRWRVVAELTVDFVDDNK